MTPEEAIMYLLVLILGMSVGYDMGIGITTEKLEKKFKRLEKKWRKRK